MFLTKLKKNELSFDACKLIKKKKSLDIDHIDEFCMNSRI